jgi:hypothetical protein
MNIDTENSKARSTAYLCYFLAALVMLVTAWFIIEGIQATEPDSSARYAKIAAGILLVMLQAFAFNTASKWSEFSGPLRLLGWCVLALQITLMSLTQIAIGTSAGKTAELSTATVAEVRAQAEATRKNADTLRDSANKLNKSKHGFLNQQGGENAAAAAKETAAAASAQNKLQSLQVAAASTPIIEMIGKWGLIALAIAISLVFEFASIILMHTAGKLSRRADSQPVDQQILVMLQQMRGDAPASPSLPAAPTKQDQSDKRGPATAAAPPQPAFDFGFIPSKPANASAVEARHNAPSSGELWAAPRRDYFLAPAPQEPASTIKPEQLPTPVDAPAAPASPVSPPDASIYALSRGASKQTHPSPASASEQTHQMQKGASKQTHPASVAPKEKRSRKASTAVAGGKKMDTGTGPHDGYRFRRVQAAIEARTLTPGLRTIQRAEGGGAPVVRGYLAKMVEMRLIKLNADGTYELVEADKSQMQLTGV